MRREERLRRGADFAAVYREGGAWAHPLFVLRAKENGRPGNRYGIVAGRQVGKAVVRNRVRRLAREALRRSPVKQGWDLVFIARPAAAQADFREVVAVIESLLHRARLWNEGESQR